jgi:excisionase family DNA binding protein
MGFVSTDEAAQQLGMHPVHVRRLMRAGELPGQKVGARWLVSEEALRQRQRLQPFPGRPLSSEMAWLVLQVVDAALRDKVAPAVERHEVADAIGAVSDRRLRYRVREALAEAPEVERWGSWLRRRARQRRVRTHPGVVTRLVSDKRLHAGGQAAAAAAQLSVGVGGEAVFYVDAADVDALLADYRGRYDTSGQVLLMVLPEQRPSGVAPTPGKPMGPAVGLVDLLGSPDARERHVATKLLERALSVVKRA